MGLAGIFSMARLFSECVEIDELKRLNVQRPIDKGVKSECGVF